jgi:hypothetical protein
MDLCLSNAEKLEDDINASCSEVKAARETVLSLHRTISLRVSRNFGKSVSSLISSLLSSRGSYGRVIIHNRKSANQYERNKFYAFIAFYKELKCFRERWRLSKGFDVAARLQPLQPKLTAFVASFA